jgi:hypothetical protein
MDVRDAQVQLSEQRLRELMLWHGKDEGNLPPAATLANLSRDTIAALAELQRTRGELVQLREALARLFWTSDSSELRAALLTALGDPPDCGPCSAAAAAPISWAPAANGLPPIAPVAGSLDWPAPPLAQRATG